MTSGGNLWRLYMLIRQFYQIWQINLSIPGSAQGRLQFFRPLLAEIKYLHPGPIHSKSETEFSALRKSNNFVYFCVSAVAFDVKLQGYI